MRLFLLLISCYGLFSSCKSDFSSLAPSTTFKHVGDWQLQKLVGGIAGSTVIPKNTQVLRLTGSGNYIVLIDGITRTTGGYVHRPIVNAKPDERQATLALTDVIFYTGSGQPISNTPTTDELSVLAHTDTDLVVYRDYIADGYIEYYTRMK